MYEAEAEAVKKMLEQLEESRRVEMDTERFRIVGYKLANASEMVRFDFRPR